MTSQTMSTDRLLTWTFGIFSIVVIIGFFFFYPHPSVTPRVTNIPLSSGDQAVLNPIVTAKAAPLSNEDEELLNAIISAPTKPLNSAEEAYFKKVVGG